MYLLTIVNISTGDLDATNPNWTGCKECKTFDPSRKAATFDPLTWALLQIFQKFSDVVLLKICSNFTIRIHTTPCNNVLCN